VGGYLFDTMVHVYANNNIPEKWRRQWKEVTVGNKKLILFEPLIAEIMYQMIKEKGDGVASNRILWVKGLPNAEIVELNDHIAFAAARIFLKFKKYSISLVDSFSLAIAKSKRAEIFTTDYGLRRAGNDFKVRVNFLPKEALYN